MPAKSVPWRLDVLQVAAESTQDRCGRASYKSTSNVERVVQPLPIVTVEILDSSRGGYESKHEPAAGDESPLASRINISYFLLTWS